MKCTISNMMQFLTYVIALGFEGLNFVYKASIAAYQSRRDINANNMLDNTVSGNQLSPHPTEAQVLVTQQSLSVHQRIDQSDPVDQLKS